METSSRPARPILPPVFAPVPELDVAAYERLARGVRELLGLDLAQYKPAQVWRRVNGFATARGLDGPDALVARARKDPGLRQAFVDMLTINVSEFFRNPEAWETLAEQFLGPLLRRRGAVRVWSAGCSLGYEPLSLAMLARELGPASAVRIEATDVDETILERARQCRFKEQQMTGVSPLRRARFFRATDGGWEATPELTGLVTFRRHDLLRDAYDGPFDIIVCRNVVIYFTESAKTEIYVRFREALRPGGVLFLGATESIPNARALGLLPVGFTFYARA